MRPLVLTLQAFGPFSQRVRVPFDKLDVHTLCLVHGATGAGKTTLLDGISYALYGQTSGNERTGRQMRCDAAPDRLRTEVELVFSSQGKRYRVVRVPEQRRQKRRGEGTVDAKSEVAFYEEADSGAKDGDDRGWTLLASKVALVDDEVQRLLGLNARQFQQVALLPQGQFRAFLLASSQERQDILQALFRTERFALVEDILRRREKALREALVDAEKTRRLWLEQAGTDDEAALEAHRQQLHVQQQDLKTRQGELETQRDLQRKQVQTAAADQRRLQAFEAAQQAVDALHAQRDAVDGSRRELRDAERAERVRSVVEQSDRDRHARRQAERRRQETQQALDDTSALFAAAEVERDDAQARFAGVSELREELARLKVLQEQASTVEQLKKDRKKVRSQRSRLVKQVEGLRHDVDEAALRQAKLQKQRDEDLLVAANLERHREALVSAVKRQQEHVALQQCELALQDAADAKQAFDDEHQAGVDDVEMARHRLQDEERARQADVVHWLRSTLSPDDACPVCGSDAHTVDDAQAHADIALLDADALQSAQNQLRDAEAKLSSLRAREVELVSTQSALEERRRQLQANLGDWAGRTADDVNVDVERRQAKLAASEAAHDRRADTVATLSSLEVAHKKLQVELEQSQQHLHDVDTQLALLDQRLADLDTGTTPHSLQTQLTALDADIQQRSQAREDALAQCTHLQAVLQMRREQLEQAQQVHQTASAAAADADARVRVALDDEGFAHADDAKQRMRLPDEREALRQTIDVFTREEAVAEARLEEATKERPEQAPDVDVERAKLAKLDSDLEQLSIKLGGLASRAERLADLDERLQQLQQERSQTQSDYEQVARLSRVVIGDNKLKLPFQRYVIGKVFDVVLEAASRRLSQMSRGRYTLARQLAEGKGRGYRGLDLNVCDRRTQTERPVATLSGGEGFLASLSLSLGLADVVRERTGGVELDAIFLDEGFAGLDPEALDEALRALLQLAQGGRLVVVVSHVNELKERIPTRLEVVGGALGSGVRMVLPSSPEVVGVHTGAVSPSKARQG